MLAMWQNLKPSLAGHGGEYGGEMAALKAEIRGRAAPHLTGGGADWPPPWPLTDHTADGILPKRLQQQWTPTTAASREEPKSAGAAVQAGGGRSLPPPRPGTAPHPARGQAAATATRCRVQFQGNVQGVPLVINSDVGALSRTGNSTADAAPAPQRSSSKVVRRLADIANTNIGRSVIVIGAFALLTVCVRRYLKKKMEHEIRSSMKEASLLASLARLAKKAVAEASQGAAPHYSASQVLGAGRRPPLGLLEIFNPSRFL